MTEGWHRIEEKKYRNESRYERMRRMEKGKESWQEYGNEERREGRARIEMVTIKEG